LLPDESRPKKSKYIIQAQIFSGTGKEVTRPPENKNKIIPFIFRFLTIFIKNYMANNNLP
jgi:hypothetical protein